MGLQAAGSSGMSNTIAETDSIMVKSALETRSFWISSSRWNYSRDEEPYFFKLLVIFVLFCPRDCNKVAHALAATGCNCPENSVLMWDSTPGVKGLDGQWCCCVYGLIEFGIELKKHNSTPRRGVNAPVAVWHRSLLWMTKPVFNTKLILQAECNSSKKADSFTMFIHQSVSIRN